MSAAARKKELARPTIEQQRAADPSKSVWVSANAGSGKTHVLVDRMIRLLLNGAEPSTILCLTYTKAAAAEMANRLFAKLGDWAILDDAKLRQQLDLLGIKSGRSETLQAARRLFTQALETPGGLKVQTIHAFCQSILHLFPVEAGLAPGFKVMDESQSIALRHASWSILQRQIAAAPQSEVATAFAVLEPFFNEESFHLTLSRFLEQPAESILLLEQQDRFTSLLSAAQQLLKVDSDRRQLTSQLLTFDNKQLDAFIEAFQGIKPIKRVDAVTILRELKLGTGPGRALDLLRNLLFTNDGEERASTLRAEAGKKFPQLYDVYTEDLNRRRAWMKMLDMHLRAEATASLWLITGKLLRIYNAEKRKRGLYDFADLITNVSNLLSRDQTAQWVLYKLDRGIEHILIDEAQDTSPQQWQIIESLTEEFFAGEGVPHAGPRTLFVVGDRKQSIFSFQGADAARFEKTRERYAEKAQSAGFDFLDVKLQLSYRSVPEILKFVDHVLPPEAASQMGFEESAHSDTHSPYRDKENGLVEIWPVVEPLEDIEPEAWELPLDHVAEAAPRKRLARHIARTIADWIGKRILAATDRPVQADDILILLQRRTPLFSLIIAELRRAGVPIAGADRLQLGQSLAVQDLLALAQVMALPSDDYSLACVLKSPLMGEALTEEELYELAHNRGAETLWNALQASAKPVCRKAAAALSALSQLASSGPYQFFATVMNARRGNVLSRLGPEALDATDAFLDLALDYQRNTSTSLAGFAAWFRAEELTIRREMDKAKGEVRIMAAHGSKGLEANIIIIPDATEVRQQDPEQIVLSADGRPVMIARRLSDSDLVEGWKDERKRKEREENIRLLYVAMTRARNELYICGSKGKKSQGLPKQCWYEMIDNALAARPLPFRQIAIGDAQSEFSTIRRFGEDPRFVEQERAKGSNSLTPLWAAAVSPLDQFAFNRKSLVRSEDRPASTPVTERGEAIHQLLCQLPQWPAEERKNALHRQASKLGIDITTADSLLALIVRPELQPFFSANSEGEVKLVVAGENGGVEELRVDRLALDRDAIYLLDYKTGATPDGPLGHNHPYVSQLARYSSGLMQAYPGKPVKPAILWIKTGKLEWLPPVTAK